MEAYKVPYTDGYLMDWMRLYENIKLMLALIVYSEGRK